MPCSASLSASLSVCFSCKLAAGAAVLGGPVVSISSFFKYTQVFLHRRLCALNVLALAAMFRALTELALAAVFRALKALALAVMYRALTALALAAVLVRAHRWRRMRRAAAGRDNEWSRRWGAETITEA